MARYSDEDISKAMSHALRHEPWLYELELDDEGWTSLDAIVVALRNEREEWRDLDVADIERVVGTATKRRHEIDGGRIRALYGHSLPGKLARERATPPPTLFHGTSPAAAQIILAQGLKPMARQYVHLSVDIRMAKQIGRRKSKPPVVLQIDARRAAASVAFFRGNEHVWLAEIVPAEFVSAIP